MVARIKVKELKIQMLKKNYKAQKLAKEVGVNTNTIYHMMRTKGANLSTFAKICHALEVKMDDLVEVVDD